MHHKSRLADLTTNATETQSVGKLGTELLSLLGVNRLSKNYSYMCFSKYVITLEEIPLNGNGNAAK